jgi:selenocysteine lyase/cysteine desulfurase
MKRFITGGDVIQAAREGKRHWPLGPEDVVTAVAAEEASARGLAFVRQGEAPPIQPPKVVSAVAAPLPAASHGQVIRQPYQGLMRDSEVAQWRKEFPILENIIHMGNCSQSAQARRVRAAIEAYLDNWLTIGMDWDSWVEEVNLAKAEFAKLIGARPEEIAVSSSVSDLASSVATAMDYRAGRSKVVVTDAEFPTINYIWLAQQRHGAKVDFVSVGNNNEIDIGAYEQAIDENTLITAITQVYYLNGFKQDVARIADIAHQKGSLIMVDAYQCLGTEPMDVKAMNIDILVSGCLKYLFGIPGIAFMYVNQGLISELAPSVTGWFGQKNPFLFQSRYLDWAGDARRFDTGTPPVMTAYAARAGLTIPNEVGVARIKDRIDMLSGHALEYGLSRGLRIISPLDVSRKASTTAIWTSHKMPSHDVEVAMKQRNIIVSARGDVVRVAPHFYSTTQEIETVMDALADVLGAGG